MPVTDASETSNRIDAPSIEQLVLDSRSISDQDAKTAGIVFVLVADETWNDKLQRGTPSLLQKVGLFSPDMACSDFLAVIVSCEESYKKDSLRKTRKDRATRALTKQLSIRRADLNEDKWEILTHTRYYGYLITGMDLEIHEMRYCLPKPPPEPVSRTIQPPSQSEHETQSQRKVDTASIKQGTSSIPRLNQTSNPQSRNKSNRSSAPSNRSVALHDSNKQDLPFTQVIVKKFDLRRVQDNIKFTEVHHALMRWAQAKYCAQYVANLHKLIWQRGPENGNAWYMSDVDMVRYWASAAPREPAPAAESQLADPATAVITSPERAGIAATEAWGGDVENNKI